MLMTEINEIIALSAPHSDENPDCPFCPEEPEPKFTTFPGEKNDSGILGDIMDKPELLEDKQPGARPKKGEANQQSPTSLDQKRPNPIYNDQHNGYGPYSCEAHHLISGKQALGASGHNFQQWIAEEKGHTIKKDTGYSVNNADNGIWAPSIPEKFKGGNWGGKKFSLKYQIAKKPMEAGHPQFHKGHHSIGDPDDPDEIKHEKYDKYLKKMLLLMNNRMHGWSSECPLCGKGAKKPFQPSVRANQVLDNLSKVVRRKISAPATEWQIFISRYALEYHNDGNCAHGESED